MSTFNEIGQNADRAFANALLVRLTKHWAVCAYRLREVNNSLRQILVVLGPDQVRLLASDESEDAVRLRSRLEDLNRLLVEFVQSHSPALVSVQWPLIPRFTRQIQEEAEELGDIVENMALARNEDFKNLVTCCVSSLKLQELNSTGVDVVPLGWLG